MTVVDWKGRLDVGQEPRPRFRIFTLRDGHCSRKHLAVSIEDCHYQKNAAIVRLYMASVEPNDTRGMRERRDAHSWSEKRALENSVLGRDALHHASIALNESFEEWTESAEWNLFKRRKSLGVADCPCQHRLFNINLVLVKKTIARARMVKCFFFRSEPFPLSMTPTPF